MPQKLILCEACGQLTCGFTRFADAMEEETKLVEGQVEETAPEQPEGEKTEEHG